MDLAWAPDDALIATCSLDCSVRIWEASSGRQLSVLSAHASFVKGVAWDPIGSFLASQSDDKSVIVWRVGNWTQEMRDDQHFAKTVRVCRWVFGEKEWVTEACIR